MFAGVQLRQEAKARKLQAMVAVLSDVRPLEVAVAWTKVQSLPDGFELDKLTEEQHANVTIVSASYNRLGNLLAAGLVGERDIFPHLALSRGAIEAWEKLKHVARDRSFPTMVYLGMLAARADEYLKREAVSLLSDIPVFDADPNVLQSIGLEVQEARAVAS